MNNTFSCRVCGWSYEESDLYINSWIKYNKDMTCICRDCYNKYSDDEYNYSLMMGFKSIYELENFLNGTSP